MPNNKIITQVLIANSSEAKIYQTTQLGKDLNLINEFYHPESREKGLELVTDRAGRYKSRMGQGRGAYMNIPPQEIEADRFARELAKNLNGEHFESYDYLIVIAPPHFHGLLNKHYTLNVKEKIKYNLEKDYTKIPHKKLLGYLEELGRPKLAAA